MFPLNPHRTANSRHLRHRQAAHHPLLPNRSQRHDRSRHLEAVLTVLHDITKKLSSPQVAHIARMLRTKRVSAISEDLAVDGADCNRHISLPWNTWLLWVAYYLTIGG